MRLTVSAERILNKKIDFFQIIFLELRSVEILKTFPKACYLFRNPSILLIHYIQKNPGNYYTIKNYIYFTKTTN